MSNAECLARNELIYDRVGQSVFVKPSEGYESFYLLAVQESDSLIRLSAEKKEIHTIIKLARVNVLKRQGGNVNDY